MLGVALEDRAQALAGQTSIDLGGHQVYQLGEPKRGMGVGAQSNGGTVCDRIHSRAPPVKTPALDGREVHESSEDTRGSSMPDRDALFVDRRGTAGYPPPSVDTIRRRP